jgi:hypothetical protein
LESKEGQALFPSKAGSRITGFRFQFDQGFQSKPPEKESWMRQAQSRGRAFLAAKNKEIQIKDPRALRPGRIPHPALPDFKHQKTFQKRLRRTRPVSSRRCIPKGTLFEIDLRSRLIEG